MANTPKTLQQAIVYFADPDNCLNFLSARRWPNGVICPTCGRKDVAFVPSRRLWQCKTRHPKAQFSVKTGTLLEDSPLGLDKWLPVMWMVANCKNGVSSWEIHRSLGVTQKTAWFMLHRIRLGMQTQPTVKLGGVGKPVEVDETFIGGLARNMHADVHKRRIFDPSSKGKTPVLGMLERDGEVRAWVVPNVRKKTIQPQVHTHVDAGSALYTDALLSYWGLDRDYIHETIDHATAYVRGQVHTNGMENFWSLLKRQIKGTYISVEPYHLFRYLDEQVWRFNNRSTEDRPMNDFDRFNLLCTKLAGKRLTYDMLTAKEDKKPEAIQ